MGGIPSPRAQLADLVLTLNLWRLIRELTAWSLAKRKPWIQLLGQALLELLPVSLAQHFAAQAKIEPWISRTFARRKRLSARLMDVDEHFGFRLPSRRTYAAGVVLMGNKLAKLKRSVLAPEEFRYPFLDRDLIEFVLSIPARDSYLNKYWTVELSSLERGRR